MVGMFDVRRFDVEPSEYRHVTLEGTRLVHHYILLISLFNIIKPNKKSEVIFDGIMQL